MTDSMKNAIGETNRRRQYQDAYNKEHGITPQTIKKAVRDLISISKKAEKNTGEIEKVLDRYPLQWFNYFNLWVGEDGDEI